MNNYYNLLNEMSSLSVFRGLLEDEVVCSLGQLLALVVNADGEYEVSETALIDAYSSFVGLLYKNGASLSKHILDILINDENIYVSLAAKAAPIPESIKASVMRELDILKKIAGLDGKNLAKIVGGEDILLPSWECDEIDIKAEYLKRIENIDKFGFGIYARHHMFYLKDEKLVPVKHPDEQRLTELIGYKKERKAIIDNTKALLKGKPAANALLYGSAGTGKSSTVKAIANEFKDEGLRIIEVRKEQLSEIPALVDELNSLPLKFIIFIDDLSFAGSDDNFSALKAILEGSVSAKSRNLVIYATSNRRHLIRESFADRDGDEIHRNDTIQEQISLSERFGLRVLFDKPNKECYLEIVHALAELHELNIDSNELDIQAEAFALRKGGRSARGARQFIDKLLSADEEENK